MKLSLSLTHTHIKKTNQFVNFFSIPCLAQIVADYLKTTTFQRLRMQIVKYFFAQTVGL